jgi:uncharacterized protein with ATP-grasp and redox domains
MSARPPPLTVHDGGFTHKSVFVRLPAIFRELIPQNDFPPEITADILRLADELAEDKPIRKLAEGQEDSVWQAFSESNAGKRPSELAWWPLEVWSYKALLDILRPWNASLDPFQKQKDDALLHAKDAFLRTVLPLVAEGALRPSILRALWGNRADLSLSAGKVETVAHDEDVLLADDTDAAVDLLQSGGAGEVALILDNCGLELLSDLVLADAFLRRKEVASRVTLFAKTQPIFVSDAMLKDVDAHVAFIERLAAEATADAEALKSLADRLRGYLASGALRVECFSYFTTPLAGWEMPTALRERLSGVKLAISKGDANYRRWLGDLHWPHDASFAEVVSYFPCPLLALRTCKAGLVVGVTAAHEAKAVSVSPSDWLVSGKFGLVQLKK